MAVSDPIADMLTKIRNASQAKHEKVDISTSKMKLQIVKIMKNEGFIKNFKKVTKDNLSYIRVYLKYDESQAPVIHGLERISTPSGAHLHSWPPCLQRLQGYAQGLQWLRRGRGVLLLWCHHRTEGGREQGRRRADLHNLVRRSQVCHVSVSCLSPFRQV